MNECCNCECHRPATWSVEFDDGGKVVHMCDQHAAEAMEDIFFDGANVLDDQPEYFRQALIDVYAYLEAPILRPPALLVKRFGHFVAKAVEEALPPEVALS